MKEKIYFLLPHFFQNMLISIFNILVYKKRYGGKYHYYLSHFKKNRTLTKEELVDIQKTNKIDFIRLRSPKQAAKFIESISSEQNKQPNKGSENEF